MCFYGRSRHFYRIAKRGGWIASSVGAGLTMAGIMFGSWLLTLFGIVLFILGISWIMLMDYFQRAFGPDDDLEDGRGRGGRRDRRDRRRNHRWWRDRHTPGRPGLLRN